MMRHTSGEQFFYFDFTSKQLPSYQLDNKTNRHALKVLVINICTEVASTTSISFNPFNMSLIEILISERERETSKHG